MQYVTYETLASYRLWADTGGMSTAHHIGTLSHFVVRCADGRERHYSTGAAMRREPYAMDIPESVVEHITRHGGSVVHEATGTIVTAVFR